MRSIPRCSSDGVHERRLTVPTRARYTLTVPLDPRNIEVIDDQMAEVIRRKSGPERLRIASGMFASARRLLLSSLRAEHPDWDEARLTRETARRLSHGAC